MFFGNPFDQKIKPTHTTFRANLSAPAGPVFHKFFISDQPDNLIIRSILQKATRCPILIEASPGKLTVEYLAELFLVEIVIPDIR